MDLVNIGSTGIKSDYPCGRIITADLGSNQARRTGRQYIVDCAVHQRIFQNPCTQLLKILLQPSGRLYRMGQAVISLAGLQYLCAFIIFLYFSQLQGKKEGMYACGGGRRRQHAAQDNRQQPLFLHSLTTNSACRALCSSGS